MADSLLEAMKWKNLQNKNPQTQEAMNLVAGFIPGAGDVQSGLMAAQDVKNKKYAQALLDSVGLLPFIPAMGGVIKEIKPAKESLHNVATANFDFAIPIGNKTVDINSLKGMMSSSQDDVAKVNSLANKMKSENGYIERLIVDDKGNVLEGQHRLNALKQLGEKQVPVSVIKDMSDAVSNVQKTGLRKEHSINIVQNAHDMLNEAKTAENAFQMFDIPNEYLNAYKSAFESFK